MPISEASADHDVFTHHQLRMEQNIMRFRLSVSDETVRETANAGTMQKVRHLTRMGTSEPAISGRGGCGRGNTLLPRGNDVDPE